MLDELLELLELLVDELLEDELLDDEEELLLEELLQVETTPPLPDWLSHVVRPIQL